MGKQILIVGLTGTFNPALAADVLKLLAAKGLQVQHASVRYDRQCHFATGGPSDLQESLAQFGVNAVFLPGGDVGTAAPPQVVEGNTPEGITLATVNDNVLKVLAMLSAPPPRAAGGQGANKGKAKKETPAPLPVPEGTAGGSSTTTADVTKPDVVVTAGSGTQQAKEENPTVSDLPPLRDVVNGICTRCGDMFEDEAESEAHLNGPMCEHKDAPAPSTPPPAVNDTTSEEQGEG